mmetsp:Transcript_5556/g.11677  ORF Transcript_5556/g.11677 Transcript_5556/m.11677 type:complete len:533 (-) Transcript_5556:593-2191(-)|eukprot:CAMPEP_0194320268 /NCGR_PEP_ID=MMETSP0171-20130528/16624_1 /TAXON_ID=218684 /ORGANISM="Corethron pennatum, Strain L29A3" /LENGTH=532 /DNA_ID=CAMNT_0039077755 /DNA_START=239 /DNA_END=1837 /DNA_ORIENTATION=-
MSGSSWDVPRPTKKTRTTEDSEVESSTESAVEGEGSVERGPAPPQHHFGEQQQGFVPTESLRSAVEQDLPRIESLEYPQASSTLHGASSLHQHHQMYHPSMHYVPMQSHLGRQGIANIEQQNLMSHGQQSPSSDASSMTGSERGMGRGRGRGGRGRSRPMTQEERRTRKNAQSRARAARMRVKIQKVKEAIVVIPVPEDDVQLLSTFEERRQRKNERSRERAIEKKMEIERILAKPEKKRTKQDKETLEIAMKAKQRKNEGDRQRRERIKIEKLKTQPAVQRGRPRKHPIKQTQPPKSDQPGQGMSGTTLNTTTSQQPQPTTSHQSSSRPQLSTPSDRPSSPTASILPQHGLPSPSLFSSPNVFSLNFPSPPVQASRRPPYNTTTPSGHSASALSPMLPLNSPPALPGVSARQLPMIPPYGQQLTSPDLRGNLHLYQRPAQIQQQRNPDATATLSMFGGSSSAAASIMQQQSEMRQIGGLTSPDPVLAHVSAGSSGDAISRHLIYDRNTNEDGAEDNESSDISDEEDDQVAI